jgi:hypothetical protein
MKLSEAIREGAKLHPKGKRYYFQPTADSCQTCALGAAYEAIEHNIPEDFSLEDDFVVLAIENATGASLFLDEVQSPVEVNNEDSLYNVIAFLNDDCDWTREQIADWLEGIAL